MFTIHIVKGHIFVPVVYFLLQNKQQRTYRNDKMTGNDRKENSEKYRKERNREINQMAPTEETELREILDKKPTHSIIKST